MVLKPFPILHYCQRKIIRYGWPKKKKNLESSIWGKEVHLKPTFPVLILCSKQSHFFLWVLHIVLSFMVMPVICHAHKSRINIDFCYYSSTYSLRLLFTFLPRHCSITGLWRQCTAVQVPNKPECIWCGQEKQYILTFPRSFELNVLSVIENIFLQADSANKLEKPYGSTRLHFPGF